MKNAFLFTCSPWRQPGVDKTLSFADFLGVVDRALADEPNARVALPESDDLARGYMALIDHETVASYVSRDFSEVRIVVRHHLDASSALLGLITALTNAPMMLLSRSMTQRMAKMFHIENEAVVDELMEIGKQWAQGMLPQAGGSPPGITQNNPATKVGGAAVGINNIRGGA